MEGLPKLDCYQVLGVKKTATAAEIRSAYKKLVLTSHPDKNPGKSSEEFVKIQSAYDTLRDDAKRAEFDKNYERLKSQRSKKEDVKPGKKNPTPQQPRAQSRGRKPAEETRKESNKPYSGRTYGDPYAAHCDDGYEHDYRDWDDDLPSFAYTEREPRFAESPCRSRGRYREASPIVNSRRRDTSLYEEIFPDGYKPRGRSSRSLSRSRSRSKKKDHNTRKEFPRVVTPTCEYEEIDEFLYAESERSARMPYIRTPERSLGVDGWLGSRPTYRSSSPSSYIPIRPGLQTSRTAPSPVMRDSPRGSGWKRPDITSYRLITPTTWLGDSSSSTSRSRFTTRVDLGDGIGIGRRSTFTEGRSSYSSSSTTRRYTYGTTSNVSTRYGRSGGSGGATSRTSYAYY